MRNTKKHTLVFRCFLVGLGFWLAFHAYYSVIGTVKDIENIWDVLYHTFDLMTGANPLGDVNNGWMEWARFVCPISTAVVFISFFSKIADRFLKWNRSFCRKHSFLGKNFGRDSVAIYGTNDLVTSAVQNTHYIQAEGHFLKHAKNHIILMDNDDESLSFYKKHELELSKDSTYIGLQQISSFLMKSTPNVSYFNVYEEVARDYWKSYSIRSAMESDSEFNIVILGYCRDNLGFQLLKYGWMNNIFRKNQKITYHVFCKPEESVRGFEQFPQEDGLTKDSMLEDTIVWHTDQWQKHLEDTILNANRILLCRNINPHILNQLLLTCTTQHIHYYDPDIASYPEKYGYPYMQAFGCTQKVLNENAILKNELHRDARERHFQYIKANGTDREKDAIHAAEKNGSFEQLKVEMWNKLSGLLKNSNIATSDYYTIHPVKTGLTKEDLDVRAELEHIRWCRFHFLCGWKYGVPKDEKQRKNSELRIHRALVPWNDLPEDDQDKDRQQVRMEIG